jgi:hypothetical protein
MYRRICLLFLISACVLLGACGSSEPGVSVRTEHDCNDTHCDVQIEIRNFGNDTFDIEYEISTYKTGGTNPTALVGELAGNHTILGGQSITLSKQFRVTGKPNTVATSVESTRRQ